jgi:hypothetical protein
MKSAGVTDGNATVSATNWIVRKDRYHRCELEVEIEIEIEIAQTFPVAMIGMSDLGQNLDVEMVPQGFGRVSVSTLAYL